MYPFGVVFGSAISAPCGLVYGLLVVLLLRLKVVTAKIVSPVGLRLLGILTGGIVGVSTSILFNFLKLDLEHGLREAMEELVKTVLSDDSAYAFILPALVCGLVSTYTFSRRVLEELVQARNNEQSNN